MTLASAPPPLGLRDCAGEQDRSFVAVAASQFAPLTPAGPAHASKSPPLSSFADGQSAPRWPWKRIRARLPRCRSGSGAPAFQPLDPATVLGPAPSIQSSAPVGGRCRVTQDSARLCQSRWLKRCLLSSYYFAPIVAPVSICKGRARSARAAFGVSLDRWTLRFGGLTTCASAMDRLSLRFGSQPHSKHPPARSNGNKAVVRKELRV